jgi:hypothetical protein
LLDERNTNIAAGTTPHEVWQRPFGGRQFEKSIETFVAVL